LLTPSITPCNGWIIYSITWDRRHSGWACWLLDHSY
jgi:hypothetical protein